MKNTEIQRIITLFKETFEGPAWHGPAVKEVLKGISAEQSLQSLDDGHNIAELVFHITAWRTFLINKLKGLEKYDVSEEENLFVDKRFRTRNPSFLTSFPFPNKTRSMICFAISLELGISELDSF